MLVSENAADAFVQERAQAAQQLGGGHRAGLGARLGGQVATQAVLHDGGDGGEDGEVELPRASRPMALHRP